MAELTVKLDLSFGKRSLGALMAAAMLFSTATEVASESITLTTYYPAPSGVYSQMITTGNTYLARDGGVCPGPTCTNVGIGTTAPNANSKLDVNGQLYVESDIHMTPANPNLVSGGSYITVPNGMYFSGGTAYFQTQAQFRAGIHNDSAPSLAINGGTSGLTTFTGYAIDCFNSFCPPNYMMRLTPNLHLNSNTGNAVIVNWDNGAAPLGTWEFRVANGAGVDQFYVTNDGRATSRNSVVTDGTCAEVQYNINGVTSCAAAGFGGPSYVTVQSGVIAYYTIMPYYTNPAGQQQGGLAPMLCCTCPAGGCPL